MPTHDTSPPVPPGWFVPLLGLAALASLACNAWLGWQLWHAQQAQEVRLTRLEEAQPKPPGAGAVIGRSEDEGGATLGAHPRRAGVDERVAVLRSLAGDTERSQRVLESMSPDETRAVAQALLGQAPSNDRNAALVTVIEAIAHRTPTGAIALLDQVQEPVLRTRLAAGIADTWAGSQADAAARWLAGDGSRYLDPAAVAAPLLKALAQWAAFDPEAATKFTADLPQDRGPITRSLGLASRAWGQKAPQTALAWVQSLPASDPRRDLVTQSVWQGWADGNPAQAAVALRENIYNGGQIYTDLAGTVAKAWAAVDPTACSQWASTLPPGNARRNALYQVGNVWAQSDPARASQWAGNLQPGDGRGAIWREIVGTWADADLQSAGVWLGSLSLGRDHDEAVSVYLPRVEPSDPTKALAWASTISEPNVRLQQTQAILARWSQRDTPAARAWAAANGVALVPVRLGP